MCGIFEKIEKIAPFRVNFARIWGFFTCGYVLIEKKIGGAWGGQTAL